MWNKKLKTCSRCGVATYCNTECQRAHYNTHKSKCKEWRETAMEKGVLEGVQKVEEARERHMQKDGEQHSSVTEDSNEVD